MKQVTQTLRKGAVKITDVPVPSLSAKYVLVQNLASVISAGTEKTKIDMGKKNLFEKARARPDLVKQVITKIKTEGVKKTLQTVNSRLDAPSSLGYSSAGTVTAVGGLVEGIQPGDRVSCGGAGYANHAEYVSIPQNLIVKVPDNVNDEEAAFATIGAIALQGVRLAAPQMGETFLVLGLGLLGQITVQLLRANGCNVIGTDLNSDLVDLSKEFGATSVSVAEEARDVCQALTGGHGVDGVIICAGTSSNQPIELCGEVTRDKGRVVVVGAVRMDVPREDFFKKEISVVISRSYGPGRYDPEYEEGGQDYPYGYVRFTERRNMETVLQLISQGLLNMQRLITHRFSVDEASDAYKLIEGEKKEPYLGILIKYELDKVSSIAQPRIDVSTAPISKEKINLSLYGAGNYATASLIPSLKESGEFQFRGLVTASGRTAQSIASKHGFGFCADNIDALLGEDTDCVMVITRHDTHADAVVRSIAGGKHVYVEKPLALNLNELKAIHFAHVSRPDAQIMVGFNRRYAPTTRLLIEHFASVQGPLVVNIRVNAGSIPSDHWIQNPKIGGGRMIGEGCHFVDLASAIVGSSPSIVYAVGSAKSEKSALLNDNLCISIAFQNGGIANITYTADGSKAMTKEYVEVFGGGKSAQLNDFREVVLYSGDTKVKRKKLGAQDKGQKAMLGAWATALKTGKPCLNYDCLMATSMASVMVVESMTIGMPVSVDLALLETKDR